MQNLHLKIALLLLLISNLYAFSIIKSEPKQTNEQEQHFPASNEKKLRYLRDQVILSGDNILISLGLNRKELADGKFIHYYSATLYKDGKTYTEYQDSYHPEKEVKTNNFLTDFKNEYFEDLSTRESYEFTTNIEDNIIQVEINGLEGDFITKNDINYTRYLSIGTANVEINGQKFKLNASLEKSYAADHSEYLFFDGYEDLSSRTYKFDLWDREGNFYLIDQSEISAETAYYRPHTWVLYKNAPENSMQKAFSAEIKFQEEGELKNWQISVANLDLDFQLSTDYYRDLNWYSGPITGTVNGQVVEGYFSYKKS